MQDSQLDKIYKFRTSKPEAKSVLHQEDHKNQNQYDDGAIGNYDRSELNIHSRVDGFDQLMSDFKDGDNHLKCIRATKTKWDKFAPYSFNKLQKQQKDETFLQLFEDYNHLKKKLNEQTEKNKKIGTKVHFLENQFAKLKTFNSMSPADKLRAEKQKDHEVTNLKSQIKKLHEKIIALTGNKFNKFSNRPKTAHKPSQKVIQPVNQNIRAQLLQERKHVRQLLIIIDQLKKTKFDVENQLRQRQANQPNIRNQSKVHVSEMKVGGANYQNKTQSQFHQYANQLLMWKSKYHDIQLIYNQMNEDKDKIIRQTTNELIEFKQNQRMKQRLQNRGTMNLSQSQRLQEKVRNLQDQKMALQKQLRQLVSLPFYQNNKQIIETQQKLTALQIKYRRNKQQLSRTNQTSIKYFAELQYKNRENQMLKNQNDKMKKQIKANFVKQQHDSKVKSGMNSQDGDSTDIDYDDYYRKILHLVKLEGEDPVWKKFAVMAKPEFRNMTQKQVKENAEKLWYSKLELLAHLEKAQVQLNTMKTSMDSRIKLYIKDKQYIQEQLRVTRARLDQWISMQKINNVGHRQFKVFEQAGIKYDDTVSVFDAEQKQLRDLQSNQNYFDLYLGHINIDEMALIKNPDNKVKNIANFISFLTIDFYNHETQHSEFTEGVVKKIGNNYSFKVQMNTYLLKYISKNSIGIQLWSPQGTATILLGKGHIYLSEIITKAQKDISNIVRGKCQIYYKDKILIASVQYRLRMRLPIGPSLEWAETKKQFKSSLAKDPFSIAKKKTMNITIERAQGLPVGMNAFVYFSVQNQDYFTDPERGPISIWDFHRQIPVSYDEQFCDQLKQKYFQFTIFDDQKDINEGAYGIAKANFTPLVEGTENLDLKLDITNLNGDKLGRLKMKVIMISSPF